jgi:hypothetical protein
MTIDTKVYGLMEVEKMVPFAIAAMDGILSTYRVQYTEDGPKLDLPPPNLLADTCFAYAAAMIEKKQQLLTGAKNAD